MYERGRLEILLNEARRVGGACGKGNSSLDRGLGEEGREWCKRTNWEIGFRGCFGGLCVWLVRLTTLNKGD